MDLSLTTGVIILVIMTTAVALSPCYHGNNFPSPCRHHHHHNENNHNHCTVVIQIVIIMFIDSATIITTF